MIGMQISYTWFILNVGGVHAKFIFTLQKSLKKFTRLYCVTLITYYSTSPTQEQKCFSCLAVCSKYAVKQPSETLSNK